MAANRSVLLLEREAQPGYYTTGRSAALFSETYGNAIILGLTMGSRDFYKHSPPGFASVPLLTPRGAILLARPDQMARLAAWVDRVRPIVPSVALLDAAGTLRQIPLLRSSYLAGGMAEPEAMDNDVNALHEGFLRGARVRGAAVATSAELLGLHRDGPGWHVHTAAGDWQAENVVNAAGAWADIVAAMTGAIPCSLMPMRRTALTVDLAALGVTAGALAPGRPDLHPAQEQAA